MAADTEQQGLTFRKFAEMNASRCREWEAGIETPWGVAMCAVAAMGELGEACHVLQKLSRNADGLVGNEEGAEDLKLQLAEELADTLIQLELLAHASGVDLEQAVISKFNKVSEKFGFEQRL